MWGGHGGGARLSGAGRSGSSWTGGGTRQDGNVRVDATEACATEACALKTRWYLEPHDSRSNRSGQGEGQREGGLRWPVGGGRLRVPLAHLAQAVPDEHTAAVHQVPGIHKGQVAGSPSNLAAGALGEPLRQSRLI